MTLQEILDKYAHLCTARQIEYINAILTHGTQEAAAHHMGVNVRTLTKTLANVRGKIALQVNTVAPTMDDPVPEPLVVDGTSAMYDQDGNRRMHWVKTKRSRDDVYNDLKANLEELALDLPQLKKNKNKPKNTEDNLLAVYPLGDPHIGMLSHGEETGNNWDLKLAEAAFLPMFQKLVNSAPQCDTALIIDLGDFWHYDAMDQKTTRSGNKVDADGRPSKMIMAGYRIMRQMIDASLERHKQVHVKIMPGNHDDLGSIFLRVSLIHIYEKEPRVTIDPSPDVFQYYSWGNSLVGIHHGHECKLQELPLVMASDMAKEWGEAQYRYWYVGHFHHDSTRQFTGKELSGCKVETFRTIIPNEGYAHSHGYRSGQDGKVIILDKEFGEVERHTVDIGQLR